MIYPETSETITVNQAIRRGQFMLIMPSMLLIFGCILTAMGFVAAKKLPPWSLLPAFVSGLALAWIYWSVMVMKWRIWAFSKVRNVHELKRKAIREKLIWPDGSRWERTEIRSRADQEAWSALQQRFDQPDVYADDLLLPPETQIGFSRKKLALQIGIMTILIIGSLVMIALVKPIVGMLCLLTVGAMMIKPVRNYRNRDAQIRIDDKGIALNDDQFFSWNSIRNDDVISEQRGKARFSFLVFMHHGEELKVQIDSFDITREQLEHCLRVYRLRATKNIRT